MWGVIEAGAIKYESGSGDELLEVVLLGLLQVVPGLDLAGGQHLALLGASGLLDLAFEFLFGLALGVAFGEDGESAEAVVGFVFDEGLLAVVGEAEAGGAVASEGGPEAEEHDVLGLPLVLVGHQLAQILLRHVRLPLVVHVQQQLLPRQQLIHTQSSCFDGHCHNQKQLFIKINNPTHIPPPSPHPLLSSSLHPHPNTFSLVLFTFSHPNCATNSLPACVCCFGQASACLSAYYNIWDSRMQVNFHLMRHAQSKHNDEKIKWKLQHPDPDFKSLPEYRHLKFNPQLVDSPHIQRAQVHAAAHHLDLHRIELIFVSPLKRCLQTCTELIRGREKEFHVVVEPLLNSRLSSAWSVGSSVRELRQEYPAFDFGRFAKEEDSWMLHLLGGSHKLAPGEIESNAHRGKEYLLELLAGNREESHREFFQRSRRVKERMREAVESYKARECGRGDILVISHSCMLNCLLGKELNEKGKVKGKLVFDHCQPHRFKSADVVGVAVEAKL